MPKIVKKQKMGLRSLRSAGGGSAVETSPYRPRYTEKMPPCIDGCPNHNKIREMIMTISLAEKHEKPLDKALEEAFYIFMETSPFPSVCGRVCPHPCEGVCNRNSKDGPVGVNKLERYIGDYGLDNNLKPRKLTETMRAEKIAVVGSGPAGMSCAYHLARRGYPVTVFEAFPKSGGMLRYGIPDYRLPAAVLDAEMQRILDMGVELRLNTAVGKEITMDQIRGEYKATFVGIGAHTGLKLRIKGEEADNVFTGTDFLHRVNAGETVEVGHKVVVIGGGDTAIDAARVARRLGAEAILLYRRTRTEMPAIKEEIEGAEQEGVRIDLLAAPIEIYTQNGRAKGMKCQRMQLGEPDSSGRRRPVPIEGDTYDLEFTTLIAAISQEPDFKGLEHLIEGKDWIKVDDQYRTKDDAVYSGGDDINLGLVVDAIAHGRIAAMAIHEMITGEPVTRHDSEMAKITSDKMMLDWYEGAERVKATEMPVAERLNSLTAEITSTLSQEEAVRESRRCMSCGICFDCGNCWSYCQDNAVIKPLIKGEKYAFKLEFCNGCKKCAENCPCGYIEMYL
ncbi:MAG: NAD(P)-binding protein [Candidatus Zixiibacteriota bacterium]